MTEISTAAIQAAETLLGLGWDATKRAQMQGALDGQRSRATALRAHAMDNAAPPALRFNPCLPHKQPPTGGTSLRLAPTPPIPLPDNHDDIAFAPVHQLASWVATGKISSRRLTELYLLRIARHDPALHAFAQVLPQRALAEADAADAELAAGRYRGPLHGIPYALKDLFEAAGSTTGWGAEPYRDQRSETDSAVAARLAEAGAVLIGKTAVGALAYGDIWYGGITRNPWCVAEGASGSSAGSASATAAGLCGFAIGTETLGSIVSPSERCGTVGLRPSFGRISRAGCMSLCPSLDKVGPITRCARDTALVLAALNGADPADRGSIAAGFDYDEDAAQPPLRLGYLPACFDEKTSPAHKAALDCLGKLGTLQPLTLPDLPYDSLLNILMAEAAASFPDLTLSGADSTLTWQGEAAWPNIFRAAWHLSAVDHMLADKLRYQVMEALDRLLEQVDILIGPPFAGPMLVASNFTGHPCLHLPCGMETRAPSAMLNAPKDAPEPTAKVTAPTGISLWAGLFDEAKLIRFAAQAETALALPPLRPTL